MAMTRTGNQTQHDDLAAMLFDSTLDAFLDFPHP
jgi:hypothetical protein